FRVSRPARSFPTRRSSDLEPTHRYRFAKLGLDPAQFLDGGLVGIEGIGGPRDPARAHEHAREAVVVLLCDSVELVIVALGAGDRSEEHTSELQSREKLVCR